MSRDKENKTISLVITLVAHALLFVLLLFLGFTEQDPPLEEEGMPLTIRLGIAEVGSGNTFENPNVQTQPVENIAPVTPTQDIVTDNSTEQIAVPDNNEKPKNEIKPPDVDPLEQQRKQEEERIKQHYNQMWAKHSNTNQNDGTQSGGGNSNESGAQGDPDGNKNGGALGGPLPGGGSYKLKGRKVESIPKIYDTSQDEGVVVVDIRVGRSGKVIRAVPGGRGTTTNSAILFEKAKEAAFKTKFSPNPDAPEEQVGSMTFVFVLGQ